MSHKPTISACLVVYNEEAVIRRCLDSIKGLVDEIVVVHDGACDDKTLDIAREYTDKVFIRDRIGIGEPHRSFSFSQATGEWIVQIDADEYLDTADHEAIRQLATNNTADGFYFEWEMWDGQQPVYFKGLQKLALFRKSAAAFQGLPQKEVEIHGKKAWAPIRLHHRPMYENISWANANRKRVYWLRAHVPYYFPELVEYRCFQTTIDSWVAYTKQVRQHPWWYIIGYPLKNMLGQLKNGLWRSVTGVQFALQQYAYYAALYWRVYKKDQELKRGK